MSFCPDVCFPVCDSEMGAEARSLSCRKAAPSDGFELIDEGLHLRSSDPASHQSYRLTSSESCCRFYLFNRISCGCSLWVDATASKIEAKATTGELDLCVKEPQHLHTKVHV